MQLPVDFYAVANDPHRPIIPQNLVALLEDDFEVVKVFIYGPGMEPDLPSVSVVLEVEIGRRGYDGCDKWSVRQKFQETTRIVPPEDAIQHVIRMSPMDILQRYSSSLALNSSFPRLVADSRRGP